jgi:hypothetical protein
LDWLEKQIKEQRDGKQVQAIFSLVDILPRQLLRRQERRWFLKVSANWLFSYESLQLEGNELNKNMKTLQAVRFISFVVLSIPNGVLIA